MDYVISTRIAAYTGMPSLRPRAGFFQCSEAKGTSFSPRSRTIVSLIFIAFIAIGLGNNVKAAIIPVAVTTCSTCTNQATLAAAALTYFQSWVNKTPPGYVGWVGPVLTVQNGPNCGTGAGATTLVVISTNIPISATFYPCLADGPHGSQHIVAKPLSTATDAGAVSADNLLMARAAAETGPIKLPPNLPLVGGDEIDLTEQYLSKTGLPMIGVPTYSLWHGILTLNIPAVEQATFLNLTTGKTFTLWSGDTVSVTDANGYTAKFQFNPGAPSNWVYVPNSIRDPKGNPVAGAPPGTTPTPGGVVQPIGPINVALPGLSPIYVSPWYDNPTPGGTVTVGDPIDIPVPIIQCPDLICGP